MSISTTTSWDRRDRQRKGRVRGKIQRTLDSAQQLFGWFAQQAGQGQAEDTRRTRVSSDALGESLCRAREAAAISQQINNTLGTASGMLDRTRLLEATRLAQQVHVTLDLERVRLETPDYKAAVVRQMLPICRRWARRLACQAKAWEVFEQA
jgi:hypothetical protein